MVKFARLLEERFINEINNKEMIGKLLDGRRYVNYCGAARKFEGGENIDILYNSILKDDIYNLVIFEVEFSDSTSNIEDETRIEDFSILGVHKCINNVEQLREYLKNNDDITYIPFHIVEKILLDLNLINIHSKCMNYLKEGIYADFSINRIIDSLERNNIKLTASDNLIRDLKDITYQRIIKYLLIFDDIPLDKIPSYVLDPTKNSNVRLFGQSAERIIEVISKYNKFDDYIEKMFKCKNKTGRENTSKVIINNNKRFKEISGDKYDYYMDRYIKYTLTDNQYNGLLEGILIVGSKINDYKFNKKILDNLIDDSCLCREDIMKINKIISNKEIVTPEHIEFYIRNLKDNRDYLPVVINYIQMEDNEELKKYISRFAHSFIKLYSNSRGKILSDDIKIIVWNDDNMKLFMKSIFEEIDCSRSVSEIRRFIEGISRFSFISRYIDDTKLFEEFPKVMEVYLNDKVL